VNRYGALLLALVCTTCGGRVDHADTTDDAGSLVDAGTAPAEIPVGDAGLICSVPVVSLDDSADECTFSMTCTGDVTVEGRSFGGGAAAIINCYVNGSPTNSLTKLASSTAQALDCSNPATLAALAIPCVL
jgi:hypothetical protein